MDSLQPGGALVDELLAQAHDAAQLEDVLGRDPGLGQPTLDQQLTQMPGVEPVGLGAPLGAAASTRLGRLGEVDVGADPLQLLDHEAPARRRLQCGAEPPASKRASNCRTAARSAGAILPRLTSPVSVSKASKVTCPW